MPRNKIDVYLQPLVKELNELWIEGVETYDSFSNEVFVMRASLMLIFLDFVLYLGGKLIQVMLVQHVILMFFLVD